MGFFVRLNQVRVSTPRVMLMYWSCIMRNQRLYYICSASASNDKKAHILRYAKDSI